MERSCIVSEENFVFSYLTELDTEKRIHYIFEIKYFIVEQHIHAFKSSGTSHVATPQTPAKKPMRVCVYMCVKTARGHTQAQVWAMVKWLMLQGKLNTSRGQALTCVSWQVLRTYWALG